RAGGVGGRRRDHLDRRHLRALARDQPAGGPMTSRTEQALGYAILGVFSIIALYPIVMILFTAGGVDTFRAAWEDGNFGTYLRSSTIVAAAVVLSSGFLSILAGYAF